MKWRFWCDGSVESGLGHLSRCLGFAERLSRTELEISFHGNYSKDGEEILRDSGFSYQKIPSFEERNWNWLSKCTSEGTGLLIDNYQLSEPDLSSIKKLHGKGPVIIIDDEAKLVSYDCDGIINFTVGAKELSYHTQAKLFLGTNYFPPRNWLLNVRENKETKNRNSLLVIAGGNDRKNILCRLIESIYSDLVEQEFSVRAVVGRGQYQETLQRLDQYRSKPVEIFEIGADLSDHLLWADACLCGGGLVKYECAFAGVPVASLAQTSLQQSDTETLASRGAVCDLGSADGTSAELLLMRTREFLTKKSWEGQVDRGKQLFDSPSEFGPCHPFSIFGEN